MAKKWMTWTKILLIAFFALALCVALSAVLASLWGGGNQPETQETISMRDADELVSKLRTTGLLIRDDGPRYWVSLSHWQFMNAQQKEAFAILLDKWRRHHGPAMAVEILDAHSGRLLATYDSWNGFKVE